MEAEGGLTTEEGLTTDDLMTDEALATEDTVTDVPPPPVGNPNALDAPPPLGPSTLWANFSKILPENPQIFLLIHPTGTYRELI